MRSLPINLSQDKLERGVPPQYEIPIYVEKDGDDTTVDSQNVSIDKMVRDTLDRVGQSAYGIVYILVGGLEDEPVEWWDPMYLASQPSEALSRLTDEHHVGYHPLEEMTPGVGLLGALWNEISWDSVSVGETTDRFNPRGAVVVRVKHLWRDLEALSIDPDQPYSPRLQLVVEAGIGKAAAVPYLVNGLRGIVVFGSRGSAHQGKIQSPTNSLLLANSASLIGSIIAFRRSYTVCRGQRMDELDKSFHRVKIFLQATSAFSNSIKDSANYQQLKQKKQKKHSIKSFFHPSKCINPRLYWSRFKARFKVFLNKCYGARVAPPPSLPLRPALYCGVATFVSCLLWSATNEKIMNVSNDQYKFTRGSYGSLVAAQYLLFAAPASQPWNAFISQAFTGLIAMAINKIPGMPIWFRTALTPAIVVFTMGKTGTIHPSAGGDALLYAHNGITWDGYLMVLFNYIFGIILAVIINNLTVDRQYPNYWTALRRLRCVNTV